MSYESKGGDEYYDKVTLTLDRKCAEDLYYSLLLALGGHDYKDSGGKKTARVVARVTNLRRSVIRRQAINDPVVSSRGFKYGKSRDQ